MHFSILALAAAAGLVAAQSTTTAAAASTSTGSTSGCGPQLDLTIQQCLGLEMTQVRNCLPNDWDCLCTQWTNVMVCYNVCPTDPDAFGASQSKTQYCAAAAAYGSSASSKTATATATAASSLSSGAVAAVTTASSASATSGTATHTSSTSPTASAFATSGATASTPASLWVMLGLAGIPLVQGCVELVLNAVA